MKYYYKPKFVFKTALSYLAVTILFSFGSKLWAREISRKEYIEMYKQIAIRQMNQYGIPASIIMAQACLESGNGNSRLAVKANNHFGIKCHNWNGKRIYHNDDKRGECFRKYTEVEDSFKDHSEFLRNGRRYQSLFDLKKTDYKAWAHGLKAAGYATNPKYANLLIEIIEKNELYKLDGEFVSAKEIRKQQKERAKTDRANRKAERAAKKAERKAAAAGAATVTTIGAAAGDAITKSVILPAEDPQKGNPGSAVEVAASPLYRYTLDRQIYSNNGVEYIIANGTESYDSIAKEYNLFTKELLKFNDLRKSAAIPSGTIIYLESKKNQGEKAAYVVQEGDTMYGISQKLGIKLLKLYELNNMKYGSEAEVGKILNLQK